MHIVIEIKKRTDATPGKAVSRYYFTVQMQIGKIPGYQLVKRPVNWGSSQKSALKLWSLISSNPTVSRPYWISSTCTLRCIFLGTFYQILQRNWHFLFHYSTAYSVICLLHLKKCWSLIILLFDWNKTLLNCSCQSSSLMVVEIR